MSGFDPEYFPKLAALESGHFWFRARNKLILWALKRYFPKMQNFFEIGCGTGFVLSGIGKELPATQLYGSELYPEGLRFAAQRLKNAELFQMDARAIPLKDRFDVAGAFDVLEHIEEDEQVLSQIYNAVKNGGGLLISVPQHPFLWSQFDEHSHHVRRYRAEELRDKVKKAGFKILFMTSFVSLILPLMLLHRLRKPRPNYDIMEELKVAPWVNGTLGSAMDLELGLIRMGARLPFGTSLFLAASKE